MIEAGLTGRASCWEQLCPLLGPPVSSSWAPSYSKALWWWWLPESSGSLGVSACGPCPEALVASFRQCMMHVALYGMLIWQQPSKYTIALTGMYARQGQKWNNWCWVEWGECWACVSLWKRGGFDVFSWQFQNTSCATCFLCGSGYLPF